MNIRGRALGCAAVAAALLATAAGCGADAGGDGEIVVSVWDDGREESSVDVAARDFEKAHPDLTVTVQKNPFDQHLQALRRQLGAGRAPDVAMTVVGYGESGTVRALADKGLLADLGESPWAGRLPDTVAGAVGDGSEVYAFPVDSMAIGIVAKKGTEVPGTYADMLTACRDAGRDGKAAFALGGHENSKMPHIVGFALAASTVYADDPGYGDKRLRDEVTFAGSDGWEQAVARFGEMRDAGCFGENAAGTTREAAARALGDGDALMAVTPTVTLPMWQAAAPDAEFVMAPFPGDDDPGRVLVPAGASSGLVVPAKASDAGPGKQFIDFYAKHRARYAEIDGAVPALPDDDGGPRAPGYAAALEPYLRDGRTAPIMDQQWPNPELIARFDSGLVEMLTGRAEPADVLESMDAVWTSEAP
ncbi:ABC transporter substrate-binding protein [Streptomyces sp. NBC_01808]|uniref:ABC transporter substrate-binding protein n=1 Tax=Streptomyces sp. NBC_01808 TaxID=2975947 RepID=UPI002DD8787D|nr:ABC transporter substrate-binding protein [Streptomyces sp. NBC_01808]WSA36270.1 ABC transporter substrate-binding protein [Streptomyces sp. NBC_01808]